MDPGAVREQLRVLTVPQLKVILKDRQLKVGGSKLELINRLVDAGLDAVPVVEIIPSSSIKRPVEDSSNLSLNFELGQIYVGHSIHESLILFLRMIGQTKTGNPQFEVLHTSKDDPVGDPQYSVSQVVRPNLQMQPILGVSARKNKVNGWCVKLGSTKYYLDSQPYHPERMYTNRYTIPD